MADANESVQGAAQGAGEQGAGPAIDPNDPRIQELFNAKVKGLVENKEQILREKKELESQFKAFKDQWGDMDPAVVKNLVTRMQNDEETKLIAEGKIDEVIARKTELLSKDYESKITATQKRFEETEANNKTLRSKIEELMIDSAVKEAAIKAGVVPSALPDVVGRARGVFHINDKFELEARSSDGTLLFGKDAKTGLVPAEWLESISNDTSHWYAGSSGAGSQSGNRGPAGQPSIAKSDSGNHAAYMARQEEAKKQGFDRVRVVR